MFDTRKNWHVAFDPFGILAGDPVEVEPQEDVLQDSHRSGRLLIDVGHYGVGFIIAVVLDEAWDTPLERHDVNPRDIREAVSGLADQYDAGV